MARLNASTGSEDELPELSDIFKQTWVSSRPSSHKRGGSSTSSASPVKPGAVSRKHRPLKIAHVNSLLLPLVKQTPELPKGRQCFEDESKAVKPLAEQFCNDTPPAAGGDNAQKLRSSPRKTAKPPVTYNAFLSVHEKELGIDDEETSEDHLSDFVVNDSDSEIEKLLLQSPTKTPRRLQGQSLSTDTGHRVRRNSIVDLTSPEKPCKEVARPKTPSRNSFEDPLNQENPGHLRL